jgi:hypothetical protein
VTFRQKGRYIYLKKYCSGVVGDVLNFMDRDSRLQEYHWQNQHDGPDEVSAREWKAREKVWRHLLEDAREWDQLVLEIVSPDSFYRLPILAELAGEILKKKPLWS